MAAPLCKKAKMDETRSSETVEEHDSHLIYIVPQKIQKRRFEILSKNSVSKGFSVCDNFSASVTHIVSDCETQQNVLRFLDFDDDLWCPDIQFVWTSWLSECIKDGRLVDVRSEHRIPSVIEEAEHSEDEGGAESFPQHDCQRRTPLKHFNHRFTEALETLEKLADFKNDDANYIRALAFRRASCVLKSLPAPVTCLSEVRKLRYMGEHSKRVVKDILENGFSTEQHDIEHNEWFQTLSILTQVYGVGPAIADKWYKLGIRSIQDVRNHQNLPHKDHEKIIMGLSFYEDLTLPVLRPEADALVDLITEEVAKILPGCRVVLIGGFRRGKESGHDIDILMSHPEEGREHGLLPNLLRRLDQLGLIVSGHWEQGSYKDDVLKSSTRGKYLRSTLDHFEKWMGILKMDKTIRESGDKRKHAEGGEGNSPSDDAQGGSRVNGSVITGMDKSFETCDSQDEKKTGPLSRRLSMESAKKEASRDRTWFARRVDLITAPASQYYYALVGWTGSKQFNRSLRLHAEKDLNMKLTSHGLYDYKQRKSLPANSEQEVFDHLKVTHREPKYRNC